MSFLFRVSGARLTARWEILEWRKTGEWSTRVWEQRTTRYWIEHKREGKLWRSQLVQIKRSELANIIYRSLGCLCTSYKSENTETHYNEINKLPVVQRLDLCSCQRTRTTESLRVSSVFILSRKPPHLDFLFSLLPFSSLPFPSLPSLLLFSSLLFSSRITRKTAYTIQLIPFPLLRFLCINSILR